MAASSGTALAWTDAPALGAAPAGPEGCEPEAAPCLQLWSEMSAEERAKLWPYLDEVSRTSYWRGMSAGERKELRSHMSERDREAMRRRFSVDASSSAAPAQRPRMCREEKRLMREQILEVHLQHLGSPEHRGARDLHAPGP